MVIFTSNNFNVKNPKQKNETRSILEDLGKDFVSEAKSVCPKPNWDYYVTRKPGYKEQWGALFPMQVKGFEDYISMWPNVFFDIPQNGGNMLLGVNVEFKQPRNMLINKCLSSKVNDLVSKIQLAQGATISIRRKEVLRGDNRIYNWLNELWDDIDFPDIDVSKCTIQYLRDLQQSIQSKSKHSHPSPEWFYEPVVLIKYEFDQNLLISTQNAENLLLDKIKILAPILEYLIL